MENNKTAILCISTKKNAEKSTGALKAILNKFKDATPILCIYDEKEHVLTSDFELLQIDTLLGDDFLDLAFMCTNEEFYNFVLLCSLSWLLKEYKSVIVMNHNISPDAAISFEYKANTMYLSYITPNDYNYFSTDLSIQDLPVYDHSFFAMNSGPKINEFLKWSKSKFLYNLYKGIIHVPQLESALGFTSQRDFCTTWMSYVSFFGCDIVKLGQKIYKKDDVNEKYMFNHFSDGTPIVQLLRYYYGRNYRLRRACKKNPFVHADLFFDKSIILDDTHPLLLNAVAKEIYDIRNDLRIFFPSIKTNDRLGFIQWLLTAGQEEYGLPQRYLDKTIICLNTFMKKAAEDSQISFGKRATNKVKKILKNNLAKNEMNQKSYPFGINLCGFIKGDFGLGESARIIARILEHSSIPYSIIETEAARSHSFTDNEFDSKISNEFTYNINLFSANPDCMDEIFLDFDSDILNNRYNIGYWAWEMPEFPEGWDCAFPILNEVWTLSDFTTKVIAPHSPLPVKTVSYAISPEIDLSMTREHFTLPKDKFIFLMMYDVRSISERKNPKAAIDAFLKSFGNNKDVILLIKLNIPTNWDLEDDLLESIKQHSNILTISGTFTKVENNSLISVCDAFVSLHRSEGFGLGPAEAMALGKPVVITNYGGNTQYMHPGSTCAVPYKIIEIEKNTTIYKKGMHWADPDIDAASVMMNKLVSDKDYYNAIGSCGKATIEKYFSYESACLVLETAVSKIPVNGNTLKKQ